MVYLNPPLSDIIAPLSLDDIDDLPFVLPCSTCILYTDGFFLNSISEKSPSIRYFIDLPFCLHSETFALLSTLNALAPHSSVVVNTDCAFLISTWSQFIDKPFLPKLLRQPNHLLWLSIRHQIHNKHLSITLQKVSAHTDDMYNIQVDLLAKEALHSPQPTVTPLALLDALCIILYDSLPVDNNIHHFFKSIYEAQNLLNFSSLSRFFHIASVDTFN
ncbi:hypothetical protein RirG_185590 [Rhizophagus irregularis DAOM 197198w]|uniref:RNase H type-1 domain-containing protein n=1 Tax=Rhizophagus irregularis (strain DAOM 197198w) TaxID=1432141 RepID=A0A015IZH6_RHIIW|nr:hypothetical protein RirG_185590 [Rhizophagus irregularis DAOM 197198w]